MTVKSIRTPCDRLYSNATKCKDIDVLEYVSMSFYYYWFPIFLLRFAK